MVMNKYFNFTTYVILLAFVLSFIACSSEDRIDVETEDENALTVSSTITRLMENTVSNDGSYDNIIDGSSCFDISFPYTVVVHGLEITIDSVDDFRIIEDLFDAIDSDEDVLDIIFPVSITLADYTETTIDNIGELNAIAEKCIEGGGDNDIECIDVIYPVTLYTYSTTLEQSNTVTVNNDKDLKRFFVGLNDTDLISVQFPVLFEMYDGTKVTVNNNDELALALEFAQNACDEDDDSDHNDDDFTEESLDSLLVDCSWAIYNLKRESQNIIEEYADYRLSFMPDGLVIAQDKEGVVYTGSWEIRIKDYQVVLDVEFQSLTVFTSEWFVYEIEEDKIKLHLKSDDDKIVLKKSCEEPMVDCTEDFISETLQKCKWAVSDGVTESFLDSLRIDFSNMRIDVKNTYQIAVDEGSWTIYGNTISFKDLSMEMANYIGDWEIMECSAIRFKIKRGNEYLVFEKDCD